jgi:hypothetical protein
VAIDISTLKGTVKSLMDTANDTVASYDLSTGMSRRVQYVNTYNPEKIMPEAHILPAVFIWAAAKKVSLETINMSLASGKRKAELLFNVAGVVWVPYSSTTTLDPADDDCEKLMENIEQVLRNSDTLGGTIAKWHLSPDVTYHTALAPTGEQAHLRVGLMGLRAIIYY